MRRFMRGLLLVATLGVCVLVLLYNLQVRGVNIRGIRLPATATSQAGVVQGGPTPTIAPTAQPAADRGPLGTWPYQSRSVWNIPIATDAAYEAADSTCSASFHSPKGGTPDLSAATWSHTVVNAQSTDAWATITYNPKYAGISGQVATIRVPANAVPSPPSVAQGGDARLYVIDPTGHYVDEMWKAERQPAGNWTVGSYRRNDLTGSGIGAGGVRAYGGSGLGGLIRKGELNGALVYAKDKAAIQQAVPHAISIAITRPLERNGWVWPAISNDVAGKPDPEYQGVVPMGQFVAIPASIDLTTLGLQTAQGLELAFALQHYGAYLVDSSDNYTWYAETDAAGDLGHVTDALNGHPSDVAALQRALVCVAGNSAATPGGGPLTAPRRTCWAPWLPTETPIPGACVLRRP